MAERAYTVKEIDALRDACKDKFVWGRYSGAVHDENGHACSRVYNGEDERKTTEDWVRTYMAAGITADDLIASEKEGA